MSKIAKSFVELIGKTPLLAATRFGESVGADANILAKLEYFNPGGSVKDRIAAAIIQAAVASGELQPGGTIVEATSGNTGIGLSAVGAALGYKVVIVMPETMSIERRKLMLGYGAQLVLTDGALGMKGAIAKAKEIVTATAGAVEAGQFVNQANPAIHYKTTGPEIWGDTDGAVDIFVAGVGTGGTLTGTGRFLKEQNPNVKVVAVEPKDSAVLSNGKPGPHKIQGLGAGFIPETLDTKIYDEVIQVANEDAFKTAQDFGHTQGILVGISSGAALWAAAELAKRPENKGKNIVVILPDTGERYLKEQNPNVKVVAVEPKDSAVLSNGKPGPHKIQGLGAGFIPETLDTKIYDEVIQVANEDAFKTAQDFGHTQGILVGISSGAALWAAAELAKRPENKGKNIVVILPDTGERYLSTALFPED